MIIGADFVDLVESCPAIFEMGDVTRFCLDRSKFLEVCKINGRDALSEEGFLFSLAAFLCQEDDFVSLLCTSSIKPTQLMQEILIGRWQQKLMCLAKYCSTASLTPS